MGSLASLTPAFAHFGLADGEDVSHGLFVGYVLALLGLIAFVIYRRRKSTQESPELKSLKRQLRDLERSLTACLAQLKNADEYPNECGLTEEQRKERLKSAASIRGKIDTTKASLAAI